jgi:hypothetical protein
MEDSGSGRWRGVWMRTADKTGPGVPAPDRGLDCDQSHREAERPVRNVALSAVVSGAAAVFVFVLLDVFIERGAFLVHFGQTVASHFGAPKSSE